MNYDDFRSMVLSRRPDLDIDLLDRTFAFAEKAHAGHKRYSGEFATTHLVEVAAILLDLNLDMAALQAAILHDLTEDTEVSLDQIKNEFGDEVAGLVKGLEKLSIVKIASNDEQDEVWKKMFLAMAEDIRIVFVKMADRLHNMRTLDFVPPAKQLRIAEETLKIHAALASRLGIYQIKSELEDLCFRYLEPEAFEKLSKEVAGYKERSEECMAFATAQLTQVLEREGVAVEEVQGRMKHLWSIYQKIQDKDLGDLSGIYDLFALRIILPDCANERGEEVVAHIYGVLGLMHREYLPLQDRFKDYLAVPKPNGYRSLHTTVLGLGGDLYDEPTEIQIRTKQMHREAEIGVASHWSYKAGKTITMNQKNLKAFQNAMDKLEEVLAKNPELEEDLKTWLAQYQAIGAKERDRVEALLKSAGMTDVEIKAIRKGRSQGILTLRSAIDHHLAWFKGLSETEAPRSEWDLYADRIFVLTPGRKVVDLPRGANPIDFAYAVHTEIGNKMVGAKVNGRVVPFDYVLGNGEVVEILTRLNGKPNRNWISLAKTQGARSKVKNWFNKLDASDAVAGETPANHQPASVEKHVSKKRSIIKKSDSVQIPREFTKEVLITGEDNLPVIMSVCCKPLPPKPIIGYVTRGKYIRIHCQSCPRLSGLEGPRFVSAHWKEV